VTARYFAFGANVHPATLARRKIEPLRQTPARLDGHRLVFDMPGIPLFEPAFASVRPADDHVWGVLYDLSLEAMGRLRSFEGAYGETEVEVDSGGERVIARVFVTGRRHRERRPSRRYLRVITEGGRLRGLPEAWIARLAAHPSVYVPGAHEAWGAAFSLVDRVHRLFVAPERRS
jgi:gamma-glutamylcyclotransferase (GGCT)/AIG2-like uncharacterized protein YtfP